MPIEYQGKKYEFQKLENKIKKQKPGIKSPGGYVHQIEVNQHKAQSYKLCKDCDYKAKSFEDLKKHGEQKDHTIMSKNAQILKTRLAGIGHDNATRGATDEEQKKIDAERDRIEALKKKEGIKTLTRAHKDYDNINRKEGKLNQLKARLQKLAEYEWTCPTCGDILYGDTAKNRHIKEQHSEE